MSSGPKSASGPVSLPVKGMHCASCVGRVEKAIGGVPGVGSVAVNLATEQATVSFLGPADLEAVLAAINKAGYASVLTTAHFSIAAMTCEDCVKTVEEAFRGVEGVVEARVNLADGVGSVRFVSGATTAAEIARAATEAGYPTREIKPGGGGSSPGGGGHPIAHAQQHQHDHGDGDDLTRATWLAFLLTLPVVALEMGGHIFPAFHRFVMSTARDAGEPDHRIRTDRCCSVWSRPAFLQERFSGALARRTRHECACCAGLRRGLRLFHIRRPLRPSCSRPEHRMSISNPPP